ncbi:TPA: hypothetical protein EYQ19_00175 [Candidatus Pacearchaeota archaeon]|nr:hypothetical protein [Candidatus Pacearchaeota archaeon]
MWYVYIQNYYDGDTRYTEDFDNYSKNVGKNIADISRETLGHMIDGTSKEFETAKMAIYSSLKE